MVIHPLQDRGLSMREACRLQSFPDWFQFQGPADEQRQQLANAVPPYMASAVGYAIAEFWDLLTARAQKKSLEQVAISSLDQKNSI
jgi:DNA (cytosine-5)-methyltransferase 1